MIFAKPGESAQQYGGVCPTGWIAMQDSRPAGYGWVATSTGIWVQYTPSQSEMLVNLTTEYNNDINELCSGMLSALLKDGAVMESKFNIIRDSNNQRKLKYLTDKSNILNGV